MPDRPLLLTGDPALLDALLRIAATAGVETEVAPDVVAARAAWSRAPLVLVGGDVVAALGQGALPRRPGVVLVTGAGETADPWQAAAAAGIESVQPLPTAEPVLVDRIVATAAPPSAVTVVVVGARGGAGASTLAGGLALTSARSGPTMLVDADPLGGGLDLVLGAEGVPGLRWPDLAQTRGRPDPAELRSALPVVDGVTLVSWHRGDPVHVPEPAVEAVLTAGRRGHRLVVVDLARRDDLGAHGVRQAADLGLLVVPAEVRALAAAGQVARRLTAWLPAVRVVARGPAPGGLTGEMVARELGLPLAGWWETEPGLPAAAERGEPPARSPRSPLARLCAGLLAALPPAVTGPPGRVA